MQACKHHLEFDYNKLQNDEKLDECGSGWNEIRDDWRDFKQNGDISLSLISPITKDLNPFY